MAEEEVEVIKGPARDLEEDIKGTARDSEELLMTPLTQLEEGATKTLC